MDPTTITTTGVDIKLSLIDLMFTVVGLILNFFTGMLIPDLFKSFFDGVQSLLPPLM